MFFQLMFMCAYVDFYVRLLDVIVRYLQWNLLVKFISACKLSTFQWNTYYCGVVRFPLLRFSCACLYIYIYLWSMRTSNFRGCWNSVPTEISRKKDPSIDNLTFKCSSLKCHYGIKQSQWLKKPVEFVQ